MNAQEQLKLDGDVLTLLEALHPSASLSDKALKRELSGVHIQSVRASLRRLVALGVVREVTKPGTLPCYIAVAEKNS